VIYLEQDDISDTQKNINQQCQQWR